MTPNVLSYLGVTRPDVLVLRARAKWIPWAFLQLLSHLFLLCNSWGCGGWVRKKQSLFGLKTFYPNKDKLMIGFINAILPKHFWPRSRRHWSATLLCSVDSTLLSDPKKGGRDQKHPIYDSISNFGSLIYRLCIYKRREGPIAGG